MEDLIKWMNVGARHTAMHMDRVMAPYGLNASQYMYLVQVCEHPGLTQDRFLQQFYLNPSNVTRAMLALEKMGFLERRCNPGTGGPSASIPPRRPWPSTPRSPGCGGNGRIPCWQG